MINIADSVFESVAVRLGYRTSVRVEKVIYAHSYTKCYDVTQGFMIALNTYGDGVSMVDAALKIETLIKDTMVYTRPTGMFNYKTYLNYLIPGKKGPTESELKTLINPPIGDLCVFMTIPGGITYICTYRLCENELVTFPPASGMYEGALIPLEKQILTAEIGSVIDCTDVITKMSGPDGTFFDTNKVCVDTAIALTLSERADWDQLIGSLLSITEPPKLEVGYCDDSKATISPQDFHYLTTLAKITRDD